MKHFFKNSFFIIVILISLISSGLEVTPVYAQAQGSMQIVNLSLPDNWGYGYLNGIWGSSASDVYAVGHGYNGSTVLPLLYRNIGTDWTRSTVDLPDQWSAAVFTSIWGSDANNVYIGGFGYSEGLQRPVLYRGNGSTWTVDTPALPAGWSNRTVKGVWGSGANDVYVVGSGLTDNGLHQPFMYRWNGSTLTEITLPALPGGLTSAHLYSVWGTGANDIYAVGSGTIGSSSIDLPLLYRWNGTAWSASVPLPEGLNSGNLKGIWGTAANNIYAVGSRTSGSTNVPLLQRWDGNTWTAINLSNLPDGVDSYLSGIWGFSSTDIYIVGYGEVGNTNTYLPLLYHYNGNDWINTSPSMPLGWQSDSLYGVWGASATDLYAIGYGNNGSFDVPVLYRSSQVGQDRTAPGDVMDLNATTGIYNGSVDLSWTAPADDAGGSGAVASYLVKYSKTPFGSWAGGTPVATGLPVPTNPGTTQTMTVTGLEPGTLYYFAVRAQDEQYNLSTNLSTDSATAKVGGLGIYDDTHSGWVYSNGVNSWVNSGLYGGTAHYLDVVGRYAEFSFTASQFVLYYTGYNNRGTLDVYVDGNKVGTINEYSPLTNRVFQSRWTSGNLGAGAHTVKFVHASGSIVDIDGIEIRNYAPPGVGTYDDTHMSWVYSNGMGSWSDGNLSGGTAHYSDVVGRSAEFSFTGSQFVLKYTGYNNRGTLDVYIDGNPTKVATINEYNPLTNRVYQSRWTSGNLGAGAHTVKFVHASGSIVDIDGIEIRNYQAPPGTGTYDDAHAGWAYGPGVGSWSNPGLSGGSAHFFDVVGRSAEFSFTGSQFVLLYTGYNNRGTLDVYVDNAYVGTINQYNPLPDRVFQSTWTSGNLGAGAHTVKFVHASGSIVDIDAIEIRNYTPPGVGTYDDTHMSWVYSNGMGSWSDGNLSGGTAHYSDVVGRSAEFSFTGSQFVLKYTGYNNRGTLDVYIDGNPTKVATINEYNPLTNRVYQSRWTSGNLGAGAHTVKFVHASGSIVDIDGIEIRNYQAPPGTGTYDDAHAGWAYGPGVGSWSNPGLSGGSAHYSDVVGRYAEFSFTGPQFVLYYTGYNNRGTLDVYVDNAYVGTINQYNPLPDRVFQSTWTSGNLGSGAHTVKFVHASGSIVDIDAIEVLQ